VDIVFVTYAGELSPQWAEEPLRNTFGFDQIMVSPEQKHIHSQQYSPSTYPDELYFRGQELGINYL
jgi:hypothetical protein